MFSVLLQFVYHRFFRALFSARFLVNPITRDMVSRLCTLACMKSYDQKKSLALFYKASRSYKIYYEYNMHLRDKRSNRGEGRMERRRRGERERECVCRALERKLMTELKIASS